jgi:hypothetical protein
VGFDVQVGSFHRDESLDFCFDLVENALASSTNFKR